MKKSNLMWLAIVAIAAMTMLNGCNCPECPKCPPEGSKVVPAACDPATNYALITESQANDLMSIYSATEDVTTTGILLESDLVRFFNCSGFTSVYAKMGKNAPPATSYEVVFVCNKADGSKEYYSAKAGTSSTGPTCPTKCP